MPSSMPVAAKPRPYRRFLNSALHTRFVRAAGISLLCHLVVAGLASDFYSSVKSFFWAFFPIGTAGVKAVLFFLSSLLIFFHQIATLKLGKRCTPSNWTSMRLVALSYSTYTTLIWYMASAWWFCEVLVWTSPSTKQLGWIINSGYGELDKLNERPIYLRMFFVLLAVFQAVLHVYHDQSSLPLPLRKVVGTSDGTAGTQHLSVVARLLDQFPAMFMLAAKTSVLASAIAPFLYTAFLRGTLWSWHMWWAKAFANIDTKPPQGHYIGPAMLTAAFYGVILSLTWQMNIVLFNHLMLQDPLKETNPLSASSKDPNGTLLNGLQARREIVRTFAFWEFYSIAKNHSDRRKNIFADFERPSSPPIFTSMLNAALEVVRAMESRMQAFDSPSTGPEQTSQQPGDDQIQRLPRLLPNAVPARNSIYQSSAPDKNDIMTQTKELLKNSVKTLGSSPNPWSPPVDRTKQLAVDYSSPTMQELQSRAEDVQQSLLGRYLLATPTRSINSAVLGSPISDPALIACAVEGMTAMLVASLREDDFGKAVQGVPPAVQTLTRSIFTMESFVQKHTGGVIARAAGQELEAVIAIHQILQSSLRELLSAFHMFLNDVGLSIRDLNNARKAAEQRYLFQVMKPDTGSTSASQGRDVPPSCRQWGARV